MLEAHPNFGPEAPTSVHNGDVGVNGVCGELLDTLTKPVNLRLTVNSECTLKAAQLAILRMSYGGRVFIPFKCWNLKLKCEVCSNVFEIDFDI